MKCAIYIADGLTQIVLSPETKYEATALDALHAGDDLTVKRGEFDESQAGYVRNFCHGPHDQIHNRDTMIVLRKREEEASE